MNFMAGKLQIILNLGQSQEHGTVVMAGNKD